MSISAEIQQRIIDLIASMPIFGNEEGRRALLIRTGFSNSIFVQFDMRGSPDVFLTNLLQKLSNFGETDDGKDALEIFLKVTREYSGLDHKQEIDQIVKLWLESKNINIWSVQISMYLRHLIRKWESLESPLLPSECRLSEIAIHLKLTHINSEEKNDIMVRSGYQDKTSLVDGAVELNDLLMQLPQTTRWLVLGDPGTGKTTLLLKEAYRLSKKSLNDSSEKLPVWVSLASFGQQLEKTAGFSLYDFIDLLGKSLLANNFGQEVLTLAKRGQIIFLMDGLDEVLDDLRDKVIEAIDIAVSLNSKNVVVITTRKVGASNIQGYSLLEVAPITLDNQRQLMLAICGEQKTQRLLAEMSARGELYDMAKVPMMLTVLSLVARDTENIGEYFRRHSSLFRHASRMLLEGRHRKKKGVANPYNAELLLAHTSLALHGNSNRVRGDEIFTIYDIETILEKTENNWLTPWQGPKSFIADVANCSNIIYPIDILDQRYKYLHRTFREYFAALELSRLSPEIRQKFVEAVLGQQGWAEVLVLLGGLVDDINEYITILLNGPSDLALRTLKEVDVLNPALAAQVLQLRPMRLDARKQVFVELVRKLPSKEQLVDSIWAYLKATNISIPRVDLFFIQEVLKNCDNSLASELLLDLFKYLPSVPNSIFDSADIMGTLTDFWCAVPNGICIIGAEQSDSDRPGWVSPATEVFISDFFVSKTPITNVVYEIFDPSHREIRDFQNTVSPNELDHHPVVKISWYEAEIFCQWVAQKFPDVRLPTECEWEKAASWATNTKYRFPWGNDWDPTRLNSWEKGPNRTTRVGTYPEGASPYGALDMAGNVWEWCLDWYSDDIENYFNNLRNTRDPIGANSGQRRIDKGGGWYHDVGRPCTFLRAADNPGDIFSHCGFRIITSKVKHTRGEDLFPKYQTPKVILDELERIRQLRELLDSLHK